MKTEEGNRIIAEFMGEPVTESYEIHDGKTYRVLVEVINVKDWNNVFLLYHTSWDWLMPVVEKISEYRLAYPEQCDKVCNCKIVINISRLHELIVEFIQFYNTQTQTP